MSKTDPSNRNKLLTAQTLLSQGRLPEAKSLLEQVSESDREDADAWYGLGIVNGLIGDFATARDCFEHVVRLRPGMARAYINLAKAQIGLGKFEEAVSAYRSALNITPDDLDTHRYLNATLERLGRLDEARAGYDRMLALSPDNPEILAARVMTYEITGDRKRAGDELSPLITRYPDNPKIAVAFAAVCKEADRCGEAIGRLEAILGNPEAGLQREMESEIHFSLGRLYDDREDYDKAFGHYRQANRLKGRTFDIAGFIRQIDEVIETFSAGALNSAPRSTVPTGSAVIIVGMPRSGTSLVEQILASHPDVAAGGELHEFANLAIDIRKLVASRNVYPRYLNELTTDICNTVARRYLDRLNDISSTSRYITNKMPHNFLYLGMISRVLPQARIIHCRRDPRDTCLSCYFQDFTRGHEYCYDLETLGAYYRQYQRLMAHWERVIDQPIHTIQYEELVADQETRTRRLLEFLDLPWDDGCLQFHYTRRLVQTASYDQVRQPLYTRSVGRWKNYEKYLHALMKGLGSPDQYNTAG
jgi:Flp pilus assembly protein TadD